MLSTGLLSKLDSLEKRLDDLNRRLMEPAVSHDRELLRKLSRERADLQPIVEHHRDHRKLEQQLDETRRLLRDEDPEIRALAQQELKNLEQEQQDLEQKLRRLLLPSDPADEKNIFLEIRAGTGGAEAALFAGLLLRMYTRYAERRNWETEIIHSQLSELDGYREVILRVIGRGAYSMLKFESGGHRVQRVPVTEAQGRIHTSTCTVAVLPEAEAPGEVEFNPGDLQIDTFRASGAGGQHVNKTDSAVRVTHQPSGLVVECQEERSQHKNKARALSLLRARLLDAERRRHAAERAAQRHRLAGSGERSERIRTYNFPQGRVTEHRIHLTLHQLQQVLDGALEELIQPLINEHQVEQLASLADA